MAERAAGKDRSRVSRPAAGTFRAMLEITNRSGWVTRDYRLLTRALVLASTPRVVRRAIVPAGALLPGAFRAGVNVLAG